MAKPIKVQQFPTKRTDENKSYAFDFTDVLSESGDGISTATWTMTVFKGTDASPQNMVSGSESISGTVVSQLLIDGTEGVTYLCECEIVTDGSPAQTLHGIALLDVTDQVKAA